MKEMLSIYAGRKAYEIVKQDGLSPESVDMVVGAAGGPKWLVLGGLDRAIFFSFLRGRKKPMPLVGSSIGAWRFSALAQGEEAYNEFEKAYINQTYETRPSPGDITRESLRILDAFLSGNSINAGLEHPWMRLCILSVYCRWPFSCENLPCLALGMTGAAIANSLRRSLLNMFFSRAFFIDSRISPPFSGMDDFAAQPVPLNGENIRHAILASGSIPMVMDGVRDIPGAHRGIYRDGGLIDYHMDLPFDSDGIILFPHYLQTIIPGWFDKFLPWRMPNLKNFDHVLMFCPSRDFVAGLPYEKIPTRKYFRKFWGRDDQRKGYWRQVVAQSENLGQEFLRCISDGSIRERIRPLSAEALARR